MIGARVAVMSADGRTLWRRARSDGSYASANDPRVLFGLGDVGRRGRRARHLARRCVRRVERRDDRSVDDAQAGNRQVSARRFVAAIAVVLAALDGEGVLRRTTERRGASPPAAAAPALHPVSLPDLSNAAASVRDQIQSAYSAAMRRIERRARRRPSKRQRTASLASC